MSPDPLAEHPILASLQERLPGALVGGTVTHGERVAEVAPEQILPVVAELKRQGFLRLSAITAVDLHPMEPRFEVVYQLHSLDRNERLRLKCRVAEGQEIDSVCPVWKAADWYEREVYDLFGVPFRNHPDLRRIMMPDDWDGHPLRKDYPVHGHKYDYKDEY